MYDAWVDFREADAIAFITSVLSEYVAALKENEETVMVAQCNMDWPIWDWKVV